jgi:hypothetical protein
MAKLTDLGLAPSVTLNSIIHIVNTGDTTQSLEGSSYKAPISDLDPLLSKWSASTGTHAIVVKYSNSVASGDNSLAEGVQTTASGDYSHAEGVLTNAIGNGSHAEGGGTTAENIYSHAEGFQTIAQGWGAHSEGYQTTAGNDYSHAEGYQTTADNNNSHAEGRQTTAQGSNSHAEGYLTIANGFFTHAEGQSTIASGNSSHSEGYLTTAKNDFTHAGGYNSIASGTYSFVHSRNSIASGTRSVVLGGQGITGSANDTVYVPNLNINTTPSNDNALTDVLVRASDGTIKYKTVSSFGGGGALTWQTINTVGGSTYNAAVNTGYVSNNGHPLNDTEFMLPVTASVGDIIKLLVMDGIARITPTSPQSVVYGTGNNDTGGSFGTSLSFFIGKYESLEVTYIGSGKWMLTNFQTTEDLFSNPITNRIY